METAASPRPRRHAPPEARRAQILRAALRCFSEKGFHAATMDDLAREAGLSKGSLYWHFASKAEVFEALSGAYALEMFGAWEALAASHRGDTIELLGGVGALAMEMIGAQGPLLRAWAEFLVHRSVQDSFAAIYARSRDILGGWVAEGVSRGELRPLDPEGVAAALTALVEGLLLQTLVDPDFDARRHWPVAWDAFAKGIAA